MTGMYVATCEREGSAWVLSIPELRRSVRVGRLAQVEDVARGLVHSHTQGNPEGIPVIVDLVVEPHVRQVLDAAEVVRRESESVSVDAVRRRSSVARRLAREGFAVRDIAHLLGVSYGRAQQLVGERRSVAPPWRVPAACPPRGEARAVATYRHEAMHYSTPEEFLAGTVAFVRDGVALDQPVMVALAEPRLTLLREAVGPDAAHVRFEDMGRMGHNPARIIPAWLAFLAEAQSGDRPVRGIGEPIWAGRRPEEVVECQIHEALLNLAVPADTPFWLRCPYDVAGLGAPLLAEAARSHPVVADAVAARASEAYGGSGHATAMLAAPLPEAPARASRLHFDGRLLHQVRARVAARAAAAGLSSARTADIALVATELATNSVRHGGGSGTLTLWQDDDAFVCEVSDRGVITDPLVGRRKPPLDAQRGRGVWLAHQLSDLVQIRTSARGTTVRVLSWT